MTYYPRPTQPCDRHCPDRSEICHATCEKYLAYAEEQNKYRQAKIESHEEYLKQHTFKKGKHKWKR